MKVAKEEIGILICDDQEVVRIGLVTLLSQEPGFQVLGQATTARESIKIATHKRPHVILIDTCIPGGGLEACYQIASEVKGAKIIVLTSQSQGPQVIAAIMAGVHGYFLKKTKGKELLAMIKRVHHGKYLLDPEITEEVFHYIKKTHTYKPVHKKLSEQEEQILIFLAQGMTNREIAEQIHLAERTVRNYVSNILKKLQLKNRVEAATYTIRRNYQGDS